jgi:CheY-like chemotaxis protein
MKSLPSDTPARRQPGTILIVDDNVDDIRWTQRIIADVSPKHHTHGVHSGEELISYLQGENGYSDRVKFPYPSLILLDLRMPGMHGFHVLGWLRDHPPHNLIPVFVLTASGELLAAQYAYELGARSFLTKPLNAKEFRETMEINAWVDGFGHRRGAMDASSSF